ncbi:hypothetical protein N7539_005277 [Penicillium diatomitis]|uniref:Fringe-like glycosyltransferase domain-containing protein n=1 Tax=Penicillium diatomitis TaxID=2819901 RepID=A0A9W9X6J7_9EURO|nr:uncharacterized protein N7539_005277 [Penicillium diatomitis]KAJ5485289.1 hypothetical protein N7539_005277 [Penicillium diatomitis]
MLWKGGDGLASASWAWRKIARFAIAFLAVLGVLILLWPSRAREAPAAAAAPADDAGPVQSNFTISPNVKCDVDLKMLDRFGVEKLAQYTRRRIAVTFSDEQVPMRQQMDQPLLEGQTRGAASGGESPHEQALDGCTIPAPITIVTPRPPKMADASHIDFGVATSISRLNESLDQFAHWAGYTRTRIFAIVEPMESESDTREGIANVKAKADSIGINLIVSESKDDYLHRYFALVSLLEKNLREATQWACIIDDDTFFLSMPALVQALGEYDHTKPMYVGGLSEGIPQISEFGIMAFGGAGVFLSRPLLSILGTVYEVCEQMTWTGDRRIAHCIYDHTTTKLTVDHRLRQLDLLDDASGFFESGREQPLSVHHWKSWFHMDMPKLSTISEVCGPSCLLRQWQFSDGWFLTNGYSIVKYGFPPAPDDVSVEMTWNPLNGATIESYLHELGPIRRKDEHKMSYLLQDSQMESDGSVTQWYILRDKIQGDQIFELTWQKP